MKGFEAVGLIFEAVGLIGVLLGPAVAAHVILRLMARRRGSAATATGIGRVTLIVEAALLGISAVVLLAIPGDPPLCGSFTQGLFVDIEHWFERCGSNFFRRCMLFALVALLVTVACGIVRLVAVRRSSNVGRSVSNGGIASG